MNYSEDHGVIDGSACNPAYIQYEAACIPLHEHPLASFGPSKDKAVLVECSRSVQPVVFLSYKCSLPRSASPAGEKNPIRIGAAFFHVPHIGALRFFVHDPFSSQTNNHGRGSVRSVARRWITWEISDQPFLAAELAPDVEQHDESDKEQAQHEHGRRADLETRRVVRVEAQDTGRAAAHAATRVLLARGRRRLATAANEPQKSTILAISFLRVNGGSPRRQRTFATRSPQRPRPPPWGPASCPLVRFVLPPGRDISHTVRPISSISS
jgi:hypothetical protein